METCTCSLRNVLRNGSCSICPLLLIESSALVISASFPLAACGGSRVGVDTCLELYPKGCAPQFERVAEKMFQIAAVPLGNVRQRRAVDDDERRVDPPLMGVAKFRSHVARARRLLSQ